MNLENFEINLYPSEVDLEYPKINLHEYGRYFTDWQSH